ncbi:MAG: SDR family NAD(P)-dependent oxidoreductase, partial [Elusimicrobiota bacterium]
MELSGKTALVTGGASGIGKAFAKRLLRGGARVALWDLDPAAAEAARKELSTFGEVRAYGVDVTDRAQVAAAAARLLSAL